MDNVLGLKERIVSKEWSFGVEAIDLARRSTKDPNPVHDVNYMSQIKQGRRVYKKHPLVLGTQMEFAAISFLRKKLPQFLCLDYITTDFKSFLYPDEPFNFIATLVDVPYGTGAVNEWAISYNISLVKITGEESLLMKAGFAVMPPRDGISFPSYDPKKGLDYRLTNEGARDFSDGIRSIAVDYEGFVLASASSAIAGVPYQDPEISILRDPAFFPVYTHHDISTKFSSFDLESLLNNPIYTNVTFESVGTKRKPRFNVTVRGFARCYHSDELKEIYSFKSDISVIPLAIALRSIKEIPEEKGPLLDSIGP
jgi:hypothetical protein